MDSMHTRVFGAGTNKTVIFIKDKEIVECFNYTLGGLSTITPIEKVDPYIWHTLFMYGEITTLPNGAHVYEDIDYTTLPTTQTPTYPNHTINLVWTPPKTHTLPRLRTWLAGMRLLLLNK